MHFVPEMGALHGPQRRWLRRAMATLGAAIIRVSDAAAMEKASLPWYFCVMRNPASQAREVRVCK